MKIVERTIESIKERSQRKKEERRMRDEDEKRIHEYARELMEDMEMIESFPGTKEEYEELKGAKFDYVDPKSPDKSISGRNHRKAAPFRLLNGDLTVYAYESIFFKAVGLGADAIVHVTTVGSALGDRIVQGIPVRRHQEPKENSSS